METVAPWLVGVIECLVGDTEQLAQNMGNTKLDPYLLLY